MTETPKKVDPKALIERLNRESARLAQREFIAPALPGGRVRIRLDGLVYEFRLKEPFYGWGRFRPANNREATLLGEAFPWQRSAYLELFPALRLILLYPATSPGAKEAGAWYALPYNAGDATQRFKLSGKEPLLVYLTDPLNGADYFERVVTRVEGKLLWFDGPDMLADPAHAEWLREAIEQPDENQAFMPGLAASERLALLYRQILELELKGDTVPETRMRENLVFRSPGEQRNWIREQATRRGLEQQLYHALEKAGAKLLAYTEVSNPDGSPGALIVDWRMPGENEHGQPYRYRSTIDRRLNIVSSGICLSGRDGDFDLTSLVDVMTGSEGD
ncbi:MAG TPA: hypothetical protein VH186_30790 [Chloroflexia bacterium]|nr:hypothetical protein [Chloroflexia bacterium]